MGTTDGDGACWANYAQYQRGDVAKRGSEESYVPVMKSRANPADTTLSTAVPNPYPGSAPAGCRGEDSVSRSRKPSVFQVGKVRDDGRTVVISGWGLGLCAAGCACHRHPSSGHLAIAEDQAGGRLGLATCDEEIGRAPCR